MTRTSQTNIKYPNVPNVHPIETSTNQSSHHSLAKYYLTFVICVVFIMENYNRRIDFPNESMFKVILKVLKAGKRENIEHLEAWEKKRILDNLYLVHVDGKEIIKHKMTDKPLLHQDLVPEVIVGMFDLFCKYFVSNFLSYYYNLAY